MDICSRPLVIVLGTVDIGSDIAPEYIDSLYKIVCEIKPDVLCAELSPEQLAGAVSTESKPEYQQAILPAARELGIRIIPLEPHLSIGEKSEEAKSKLIKRIMDDPCDRMKWEMWSQLEVSSVEGLKELIKFPETIQNIQAHEFDVIHFRPWYAALETHFPDFAELWGSWNHHFLSVIEQTITCCSNGRILITVGLAHKYWLFDRLRTRCDIDLHNLVSLRSL